MGSRGPSKCGLAAATVLATSLAVAAPSAELVLVQPSELSGCVDEAKLKVTVTSRLGYDPFTPHAKGKLLVRVERREQTLFGSVDLVDELGAARGRRELSTPTGACDELLRALALSISLAVDPEHAGPDRLETPPAALEPSRAEPPPSRAPVPPPDPTEALLPRAEVREPGRRSKHRRAERWAPAATLAAAGMVGVAPAPALGAQLELQLGRGPWSAGLGGRWVAAAESGVVGDARLRASLAAAQLSGCLESGVVEGCALALLGSTRARAAQVDAPRTDSGLFAAVGARLGVTAPMSGHIAFIARIEALVVARPVEPRVDDVPIWTAPRLAGGAALGLRAHF